MCQFPEETQVPEIHDNEEISTNYVLNRICWNRNEVIVDDIFAYNVALNVIHDNEDHEPKSIQEFCTLEDVNQWDTKGYLYGNAMCKATLSDIRQDLLLKDFRKDPVLIMKTHTLLWWMQLPFVYVDNLNIIGTPEELPKAINCLKKEFEMKDLGQTKYCLGLQVEHLKNGILVHQEANIAKVLK
ncbi:hypothetical protein Sango_1264000 [Sesamum angolense]|uniref:Mitochondrial protein n=1 Tax=Sesamum angolense TaxID=2727404 RepID=A0AAE1WQY8_9LAMI|nr:hypothetical protein Sango_1264000 [Sesamum angolense]